MQKFIIIMILLFILCCGLTTIIDKNENTSLIKGFALKEVIANNDTENVVNINIIKGLTLVTDERFKTELIRFLKADEERNDEVIYNFLSKQYLCKYYSSATNVEEFKKIRAKNESEILYKEIVKFNKINHHKCQIDLICYQMVEGYEFLVTYSYFFVHEDGLWKLDKIERIKKEEITKE
ncbi:MAG: hypothetical protein GXY86_12905 [Firmicutes bacterium]|nr:hypothetical protein [Bacillota bacterium]